MQAALQHTYIQCSIRLSSHDGAPPRPKTYKLLQDGCGATCLQREKDCQEEPGHRLRESGRNSLTCAAGLVDFPPATHPYIHRDPGGDKTVMMGQDWHFKEEAHSFQNGWIVSVIEKKTHKIIKNCKNLGNGTRGDERNEKSVDSHLGRVRSRVPGGWLWLPA